jgi:hypothetical protein
MIHRHRPSFFLALGLLLAALGASEASAVSLRSGLGFDAQALGLNRSLYWVQDLATGRLSQRSATINFTVLNPFVSSAEFDHRWGAGSSSRKKWVGPDNELVTTVRSAMEWAFKNSPELLGGGGAGYDGHATELEVIDACATGYGTQVVVAYAKAEWPGTSPERRIEINDKSKPSGDFAETNPYWPVTMYFHNTYQGFYPFSPQVPILSP